MHQAQQKQKARCHPIGHNSSGVRGTTDRSHQLFLQVACLAGLVEAKIASATATDPPANFDEWILRCQGQGIADLFMRPYNFKVQMRQPLNTS